MTLPRIMFCAFAGLLLMLSGSASTIRVIPNSGVWSSNALGGFSAGKRNVNYNETEEHKIKPHKLRNLRDHECVLVHCERGFRRVTLPRGNIKMVSAVEAMVVQSAD